MKKDLIKEFCKKEKKFEIFLKEQVGIESAKKLNILFK